FGIVAKRHVQTRERLKTHTSFNEFKGERKLSFYLYTPHRGGMMYLRFGISHDHIKEKNNGTIYKI
ncbi:hypothetical protein, partial [Paraglaciecola sp. 20A4]|uniref:hypothetical protein n=1 Tax=Paraglaciecola sp. 20A4 TaxID=2687288 RepID=UPI00197D3056